MKRGPERPRSAGRRAAPPPRGAAAPRVAPLPLRHPAWALAGLIAAFAVAWSVSFVLYEKDFWQHLAVGRAIWQLGHVPTTQVWTWPTYGEPGITPSWGFRLLIWPVWQSAGVGGLFGWEERTFFAPRTCRSISAESSTATTGCPSAIRA